MGKTFLICAVVALLTSACANTATDEPKGVAKFANDPRLGEQVGKICFNQSIDGFSDASKDTVVLSKGVKDDYLVEVFGSCYDLQNAGSIGIESTMSCVNKNDYLIVSRSPFSVRDGSGMGPQRCAIKSIYKWNRDAKPADAAAQ